MKLIAVLIGLALLVGYAESLYYIAQSRRKKYLKLKFFSLLALPYVVGAFIMKQDILSITAPTPLLKLIILTLGLIYLVAWAYTLYKVAGEQKRRWFYVILIFNFMFLFYLFVEDE